MTFKINHDDTYNDSLIPEGEYEVFVKEAKEDYTKNGIQHISVLLVVRDDAAQKYKGAHIWHKIWRGKDNGQYNMQMINTVGKALQIPNGKEYPNLETLLADFVGKHCKVKIKHEEYNGYTNARVVQWQQSKLTAYGGLMGNDVPPLGEEIVFNEQDCPF